MGLQPVQRPSAVRQKYIKGWVQFGYSFSPTHCRTNMIFFRWYEASRDFSVALNFFLSFVAASNRLHNTLATTLQLEWQASFEVLCLFSCEVHNLASNKAHTAEAASFIAWDKLPSAGQVGYGTWLRCVFVSRVQSFFCQSVSHVFSVVAQSSYVGHFTPECFPQTSPG